MSGAGKGDKQRPTNKTKYDESYTKTFGEKDPIEFQKGKKTVILYPSKTSI